MTGGRTIGILAVLLMAMSCGAYANTPVSYETDSRAVVRADRTHTLRHTVRIRVLDEAGVRQAGQQTISFVDGMETLAVVEAYTLKPDGRQIPIDPTTIATRATGSGPSTVYLRDGRSKTLNFPDVAVGDVVVFTTDRDVKQTTHEGHFSYQWTFQRSLPWASAVHVVEAPKDVPLNVALRFASDESGLSHRRVEDGGVIRHIFAFKAPSLRPAAEEPGAVAAVDRDPGFVVTTFPDYETFGRAYWRDARRMMSPTPQIEALSAEITRGLDDPRAKADAIERWIKRNIRYVAVYLGRQRWIPNPASQVLANKFGDCKDQVALMTVLLEAAGLAVEHALVNHGTSYIWPDLPPGVFNHVMVHLPQQERYLDPTGSMFAPGVLSVATYDKPVLLVSEAGVRRGRTPVMTAEAHRTTLKTIVTVGADGSVSGESTQTATGIFAASARTSVLSFQAEGFEQAVERTLQTLGSPGRGQFQASSPSELREPYTVKATFTLAEAMATPLTGSRRTPIGVPVHARPGLFLLGPRAKDRQSAFLCLAGIQEEEIDITFAPGLPLPRTVAQRAINHEVFTYTSSSTLDGRTLKIRRTFRSDVPGQVCPASLEAEIEGPLADIRAQLGSVLVFGTPTPIGVRK